MFQTDYLEYFAPDFSLYPDIAARIENQNTKQVRVNRDARMRVNLEQLIRADLHDTTLSHATSLRQAYDMNCFV